MTDVSEYLRGLFGLEGRRALVTGGGRGIGRGLSLALARAGAAVVVTDVDRDGATEVARAIEDAGGRAVALEMDCMEESSVVRGVAGAASELGGLDILVNNAGVYPLHTLEDMEQELFDDVYRLNVRGTFLCTREAVKAMRESGGGGAILNLASGAGKRGLQPGLGAYGPSKAAVIQFTRNAAVEFAPDGIRVNAIAPGFVRTEGTDPLFAGGLGEQLLAHQPLKIIGTPEDLVGIAIALLSQAGSFVTGATYVIDGGFLLL
ncbi:MAG: glucose 1-dehydrogenase [Acidimicrobiia bacterium]|nr:glucose 1-dehydrogenase [Acidimicrobiia bacterium]